jgi:predicted oxidoreductase
MIAQDDDLRVLALKSGIAAGGLPATVARYNEAIARGAADPFGREFRPVALTAPPFVAVRMAGWTLVSFAGIAVDGELHVIRPDGRPVPNLYAAGEALGAGATSGSAYTNGSLVTPALAFGRWLGQRVRSLPATA